MHPLAYDSFRVIKISVSLKKATADGKKEKRIADFMQRRIEALVKKNVNSPYYETIEAVRRFLDGFIKKLDDDQVGIVAINAIMRGKAGPNGNSIGTTMIVP